MNQIPADTVDLHGTLALIEEHFAAVAKAVADGEFALWLGSGISREKAPDLAVLAADLIEHLRAELDPNDAGDPYRATLERIMRELLGMDQAAVQALPLDVAFNAWPDAQAIAESLRNRYSEMLNLRVTGKERDYLLWAAVDVRAKYGSLNDPDVEHLSVALLVLEGAVTEIASGNWDGLIEVAVDRLSATGRQGILRKVVNPDDIREPVRKPAVAASTAQRNATLQGAYLMIAARALGLDCGPMSGFDVAKVNAEFWKDTEVTTDFLCSIGHGSDEGLFERLPRPSFAEVNTIV